MMAMAERDARDKIWPMSALWEEIREANGSQRMADASQLEVRAAMDALEAEYKRLWEQAVPGCEQALGLTSDWLGDGKNYMRWVETQKQAYSMADELVLEELRASAREVRLKTSMAWEIWDKYQTGIFGVLPYPPKKPDFPRPGTPDEA